MQEQEYRRRPGDEGEAVSSNADDRTLHELYAWPFMDSLREGAGALMCSYQRINNSYGCQNSYLLNGVLKTELGFEGFVVRILALHINMNAQHHRFPIGTHNTPVSLQQMQV
jgi:beta-glucosidase